ncbi:MAG: GntR family transcriptional regulator [Anaerolineaceae bacterium]|nr:GntR family transcriptional regulator [Anaerolineaceae bacterium]
MDLSKKFESMNQWGKDVPEGVQLTQRVTDYLRKLIMDGTLTPETQLPNEHDLSADLNISRSTVRTALATLEQGGFIQRRWGVGTFVSKNPPTYNNLSLNSGVTQLIRSAGAEPGCSELFISNRPASERVSSQLSIDLGAPTLVIERVRLANEHPAVFSVDVLPYSLFHQPDHDIPIEKFEKHIREQQSVYGFLRQYMSLEIHHGIAWIHPLSAEQYIADKLQIPLRSNILHIEQVDFDFDGEPVALTDEYYVADVFRFYIYRSNLKEFNNEE